MTGRRLRRALQSRPGLIQAVLLAFLIQMLSAGHAVGHRHVGGDTRHNHAGHIAGEARPAPSFGQVEDVAGVTIAMSHADGWHQHVCSATLAGAVARLASLTARLAPERRSIDPVLVLVSAEGRAPHVRGPPAPLA
jgi:hypothetical protein